MEKAFNIFLYSNSEDNLITNVGYVVHFIQESDNATLLKMKESVNTDFKKAEIYPFSKPISHDDYFATVRIGNHFRWFEQIFQLESASANPLVGVTHIVDGRPKIDLITGQEPFRIDAGLKTNEDSRLNYQQMEDYLTKYISEEGFDLPRLIHDDYFEAIKLLLNNGHLISSVKLLLSCLDTLAFIEYGDRSNAFKDWLRTYADLSTHTANEDEIWELRNSLLHMTNLSSRKVIAKKRSSIIVYRGELEEFDRIKFKDDGDCKYLNLDKFLKTVYNAISLWCKSYSDNPEKLEQFVKRYDLIVSDSRLSVLKY